MKFKILFLVFVLILLVGSVYAFSFGKDNVINNFVNNIGLNKPFLNYKDPKFENEMNRLTAKAVDNPGTTGACVALNGVCVGVGEECPLGYWWDPSLINSCLENQKCCTENIIYTSSVQSVGRVYVYSGISLVARIDPE